MRIAAVAVIALALTAGCATTPPPYNGSWGSYTQGYTSIAFGGFDLVSQDAERLEQALKQYPNDVDTRLLLVGYYRNQSLQNRENTGATTKLAEHILWIVRNRPWAPFATGMNLMFSDYQSKQLCSEISGAWNRATTRYPTDPRVWGNAGDFFDNVDLDKAAQCFAKAVKLAPGEPSWHASYGKILKRQSIQGKDEAKKKLLEQALAEYETADRLDTKSHSRSWYSQSISELAMELGDLDKAQKRAFEVLNSKVDYLNESGHLIMARVELARGNRASLRAHTREAVEAAAKQNNKYRNPDRDLISEMLAKGYKDEVLEYLKLCEVVYRDSDWSWRLKSFQKCIKAGAVPEGSDWWGSPGSSPCTSTAMSTP